MLYHNTATRYPLNVISILLHSLITVLWYSVRNYVEIMKQRDIRDRLHVEFCRSVGSMCRLPSIASPLSAQSSQAERTFNRVLTQLGHDGFTLQIFSCENVVWDLYYGVTQRPECEGVSMQSLAGDRAMEKRVRCTLLACILLRF